MSDTSTFYGIHFWEHAPFPPDMMVGDTVYDELGDAIGWIVAPEKPEITEDGIDKWLRDFQREHDELRHIGTAELLDLAHALHDDIPLGYEASMRLANWLICAVSDVRRGDASDVAEGQREEDNEHDGTA
jgi:hypothetical protein